MIFLYYISLFIISYFLWALIHEMSHVMAAMRTVGVSWYSLRVYPHFGFGRFNWASCIYFVKKDPSRREQALISLAPRIMGTVAATLFPLSGILINSYGVDMITAIPLIFLVSGILDVIVGSLGISDSSDLVIAASALQISPWKIRVAGFLLAFLSLTSFYLITR